MRIFTEDYDYEEADLVGIDPDWLFFTMLDDDGALVPTAVPNRRVTSVEFADEHEARAFAAAARAGHWLLSPS